jgi:hypothetical protein
MNQPSHRRIEARCHCGNIRVALDWPDAGTTIPVRACGCDFCTKHGGRWTLHPDGRFQLSITDPARVTAYRFGTNTADFHVCASCGAVPIVTCVIEGDRYAVINANCFEGVERSQLVQSATDFEGETIDNRLARRRRNWTREAVGESRGS